MPPRSPAANDTATPTGETKTPQRRCMDRRVLVTFRRFENIGFDEISSFRTVREAGPYKIKVKFYFTRLGCRAPLLTSGAQARAASIACGKLHGYSQWRRYTSQRRGRGVLIEPRRIQTKWWRMRAIAKPMPPPPRGGQKEGARGNHGFPRRVLLVVIFKTRTPCASKVR